jgi:hypothetical protein
MFTFSPEIPENIHAFLIPLLAPWIGRRDNPLFALETVRFGLVTFRRSPWPPTHAVPLVSAAGEVDSASLQEFSDTF